MDNGRTVTLELLRHGPPHNQLLSPITQYLALCGNHPAMTVQMPFEHKQLLIRLRALRYKDSPETMEMQLKDTSQLMGEILARVPGLIAELAEAPSSPEQLTHLRLILSASELALLPFELASSPNGFPGTGQPLALQTQLPLCITREVRRVSSERFHWPDVPRILFAAAAPPGVGSIPLESHLLALRKVIDPWVRHFDENDPADKRAKIEEHLVVLPQADVDQIQKACSNCAFTHVHILAHGVPYPQAEDTRYGLALHLPGDPSRADIVDGVRLGALLRTPDAQGRSCGPAVVTLASCDSGNQGTVVGAGASIAHTLHETGVPLVVGAQFPLSFAASILMVEVLYERLLWGMDPRALLYDLRMQLKSRIRDTDDWAGLIVYASLPPALGEQLSQVRLKQARRAINAAMDHADHAISAMSDGWKGSPSTADIPAPPGLDRPLLAQARAKIEAAKQWLGRVPTATAAQETEVRGLMASTAKRQAEIEFRAERANLGEGTSTRQSRTLLLASREEYRKAFEADLSCSLGAGSVPRAHGRARRPSEGQPGAVDHGTHAGGVRTL